MCNLSLWTYTCKSGRGPLIGSAHPFNFGAKVAHLCRTDQQAFNRLSHQLPTALLKVTRKGVDFWSLLKIGVSRVMGLMVDVMFDSGSFPFVWIALNYVEIHRHQIPGTKRTLRVKSGTQIIDRCWRLVAACCAFKCAQLSMSTGCGVKTFGLPPVLWSNGSWQSPRDLIWIRAITGMG